MIYLVAFVVLVLATARLTRLVYFDDITLPIRNWIDSRFGPSSFISKVVWCPWCASVWVAFFTCPFCLAGMWMFAGWTLGAAAWASAVLIPAVCYPAGWIVERETTKTSRGE